MFPPPPTSCSPHRTFPYFHFLLLSPVPRLCYQCPNAQVFGHDANIVGELCLATCGCVTATPSSVYMIICPPAPSQKAYVVTAIELSICKFPSVLVYITLANGFLQYFASLTTLHTSPPMHCIIFNTHAPIQLLVLARHFPTHTTR